MGEASINLTQLYNMYAVSFFAGRLRTPKPWVGTIFLLKMLLITFFLFGMSLGTCQTVRAEQHPRQARHLLHQRLEIKPKSLDELAKDHMMDVSLQQDMIVLMEEEAIWRVERGLSKAPVPNMLQRIDVAPLVEVDPLRVTIIR